MASATTSIAARIEWCRQQRAQSRTQRELDAWRAEEEGLLDAVLNIDQTCRYRQASPGLFLRYAMGLQDGQVLKRVESVESHSLVCCE